MQFAAVIDSLNLGVIMLCSFCRQDNPEGAKFCNQCGRPLLILQDRNKSDSSPVERRQLTVMFCDLVGSTLLSGQLDAEVFRSLILDYHHLVNDIAKRHDGHISQYLGDGLLIFFGFPVAREDAAIAAVKCGLEVVSEIKASRTNASRFSEFQISVRIGIHTGLVVVDDSLAMGEATNVASRVQSQAAPNQLLISRDTLQLVEGYFKVRDLGYQRLKGISKKVNLFEVVAASGARTRMELKTGKGLTPLAGRHIEEAQLMAALNQAMAGWGCVIQLLGDPGMGKSRLVEFVKGQAQSKGTMVCELRCSIYAQQSSLWPVKEMFEELIPGLNKVDTQEEKAKMIRKFAKGFDLEEINVLMIGYLLGIEVESSQDGIKHLTGDKKRQTLYSALNQTLREIAHGRSLVLIAEDLHWSDPTTLEWLLEFISSIRRTAVLVVSTARPIFQVPWKALPTVQEIIVDRLSPEAAKSICLYQTNSRSLPPAVLDEILSKTDGVPLFIEELTRMVLESGQLIPRKGSFELRGKFKPLSIPTSLQDSLIARLDMMGGAKETAQQAAVIGREFSIALMKEMHSGDELILIDHLKRLEKAQLIKRIGEFVNPHLRFMFKHALIRDAAYHSLLISKRQEYHAMLANALIDRFVTIVEKQPEVVAYHFTQSERKKEAVYWWFRAGSAAMARYANGEALQDFQQGLSLLESLPPTERDKEQEIDYLMATAGLFAVTQGYSVMEVETHYNRAYQLIQSVGSSTKLFYAICGLWSYYLTKAQFSKTKQLGTQLLEMASDGDDSAFKVIANTYEGNLRLFFGELEVASHHYREALKYYSPDQHRSLTFLGHGDLKVLTLTCGSMIVFIQGYSELSHRLINEALELAENGEEPVSKYYAYHFARFHYYFAHQPRKQLSLAEKALALALEKKDQFWISMGHFSKGAALTRMGDAKGIKMMDEGFEAIQSIGLYNWNTVLLTSLAESRLLLGQKSEAIGFIDRARKMMEQTGETFYGPEILRLQAKLMPDITEATHLLVEAVQLAEQQGAQMWALRSMLDLVTMCDQAQDLEDRLDHLQVIYDRFTEGFQIRELKTAKRLLKRRRSQLVTT